MPKTNKTKTTSSRMLSNNNQHVSSKRQRRRQRQHFPKSSSFLHCPNNCIFRISLLSFFLVIASCSSSSSSSSSHDASYSVSGYNYNRSATKVLREATSTNGMQQQRQQQRYSPAFLLPSQTATIIHSKHLQGKQQSIFSLCSSLENQPHRRRRRRNRLLKKQRQKSSSSSPPPYTSIENEIGCSPMFNYQPFDPLNLSFASNDFVFYREAELKHGRVAMMATIGMIVPDILKYNQGYGTAAGQGQEHGWNNLMMSSNSFLEHLKEIMSLSSLWPPPTGGIKAIQMVPWEIWVCVILCIGFLELVVFVPPPKDEIMEGGDKKCRRRRKRESLVEGEGMPGDYGVGYFGLRDKSLHERSLLSELENGRLAMIAFVIQVVLEMMSGQTIVEQWMDWFS